MSSKVEPGCPIGLVGDAALYDKFYADTKKLKDHTGYYPWYSDPKTCILPDGLCLITKSKKYEFEVRQLSFNLYIISDIFLKIINQHNAKFDALKSIEVRNKNGDFAAEKKYFIVRFPYVNAKSIIDFKKSDFLEDHGIFELKKIVFVDSFSSPLFPINNLVGIQSTLFCSNEFFKSAAQEKIKGVNFFEENSSSWQLEFDFLESMGESKTTDVIWPV
jgi:hypothetical protein